MKHSRYFIYRFINEVDNIADTFEKYVHLAVKEEKSRLQATIDDVVNDLIMKEIETFRRNSFVKQFAILDAVYCDHPLKGDSHGKRDCHVEPAWIVIYAIEAQELVRYRTGSHADVFR